MRVYDVDGPVDVESQRGVHDKATEVRYNNTITYISPLPSYKPIVSLVSTDYTTQAPDWSTIIPHAGKAEAPRGI